MHRFNSVAIYDYNMNKTEQINFRLSSDEVAAIDRLIASGDFETRTEFIKFCMRKVLAAYDGNRIGFEFPGSETEKGENPTS